MQEQIYGETHNCTMDGKDMDKAKGAEYLKKLPGESNYYIYFTDTDEQQ